MLSLGSTRPRCPLVLLKQENISDVVAHGEFPFLSFFFLIIESYLVLSIAQSPGTLSDRVALDAELHC